MRNRLAVYRKQTLPVIEFYRERGCLATIAGNQSPERVFQALTSLLDEG